MQKSKLLFAPSLPPLYLFPLSLSRFVINEHMHEHYSRELMSSGFFHFGLFFVGQPLGRHFIIAPNNNNKNNSYKSLTF